MFALVDCNSFFASCEKVFRPHLADKPVVVLSNNDGVVVARSPEAKRLGIPMGEAFFKIRRLVEANRVYVFSGNFNLYNELSRRVMKTLENWTSEIEIYSIDEAFLGFRDLTTAEALEKGREIVRIVPKWTGIPVSVGVAPTKTLAKVANETAKADGSGVCVLIEEADRVAALERFDIADVWGVGRSLVKKFRTYGLRNALQLSRVDPLWMRRRHSIVLEKTVRELRGEPCFVLDDEPRTKQSIQVSRSFGQTVDELRDLEEAVTKFASRAAEKLREQGSVAGAVQVYVGTNRFHSSRMSFDRAFARRIDPRDSRSAPDLAGISSQGNTSESNHQDKEYYSNTVLMPFAAPTAGTLEIVETALVGLRRIFQPGRYYKKAGVVLVNLQDRETARSQGDLFEKDDCRTAARREEEEALSAVMDRINRRFGTDGIFLGSQGVGQSDWHPKREMRSQDFFGSWDDLPTVR